MKRVPLLHPLFPSLLLACSIGWGGAATVPERPTSPAAKALQDFRKPPPREVREVIRGFCGSTRRISPITAGGGSTRSSSHSWARPISSRRASASPSTTRRLGHRPRARRPIPALGASENWHRRLARPVQGSDQREGLGQGVRRRQDRTGPGNPAASSTCPPARASSRCRISPASTAAATP